MASKGIIVMISLHVNLKLGEQKYEITEIMKGGFPPILYVLMHSHLLILRFLLANIFNNDINPVFPLQYSIDISPLEHRTNEAGTRY